MNFDTADRHRMFRYLPLKIFCKYTNICQLIIDKHKAKHGKKPLNIQINKKLAIIYKKMVETDVWDDPILNELDFEWPKGSNGKIKIRHAAIWSLTKKEQQEIHEMATDHQKKFIYLPRHVFKEATNAVSIIEKEAKRRNKNLKYLDFYVNDLHKHLAIISGWCENPFMQEFDFVEEVAIGEEIARASESTSEEAAAATSKIQQVKPIPSTSKQADTAITKSNDTSDELTKHLKRPQLRDSHVEIVPKSNKSEQIQPQSMTHSSKQAEPIPSTSKQTDAAKTKLNNTEINKSPKNATTKNVSDKLSERSTHNSKRSEIPESRDEREDQFSTCEKARSESMAKSSKQVEPVPSTSKQADILEAVTKEKSKHDRTQLLTDEDASKRTDFFITKSKEPEIIRSPKKKMPAKTLDKPNMRQSILQKIDMESTSKNDKNTNRTNDTTNNGRKVQNKLPEWLSKIPLDENEVPNKIAKRQKLPNQKRNEHSILNERPPSSVASIEQENMSNLCMEMDDPCSSEYNMLSQKPLTAQERMINRPSKFQYQVQHMSYDEFIKQTNIVKLVKKAHFNGLKDINQEDMDQQLKFYYEFRMKTCWHSNAMRNLTFNESDRSIREEPNEFQRDVMAMDYDTFIKETNVTELVEQEFNKQFNGTRQIAPHQLEAGLQQFNRWRKKYRSWLTSSLKNLKYKTCECRRNKNFVDKSTQAIEKNVQDQDIQCDLCPDQHHIATNTSQIAMKLSIHDISTSEIIHMKYDMEADSNEVSSTESQDASRNTQMISGEETQFVSSGGSVAPSGQFIIINPQSQQILSITQVRLSEFIDGNTSFQENELVLQNPLEVSAYTEINNGNTSFQENELVLQNPLEVSAFTEINNVQHQMPEVLEQSINLQIDGQIYESQAILGSDVYVHHVQDVIPEQNDPENPIFLSHALSQEEENVVPKKEPSQVPSMEYRLLDDSDIEIIEQESPKPIDISDEQTTQDLQGYYENMNVDVNKSSSFAIEPLQTSTPRPQVPTEQDREELINALTASPMIESSEASTSNSPFRNIVNVQASNARTLAKNPPINKRPSSRNKTTTNAKRRRVTNDDSLSNIQVPKYTYRPLTLHCRSHSAIDQRQSHNLNVPSNIEEEPHRSSNYIIEESSSIEMPDESETTLNTGMVTDSCVERANLLNQDNTLFLDINTQHSNSDAMTSNQLNRVQELPSLTNTNLTQPDQTISIPGPSRLNYLNEQTEFLYYIDIQCVESSLQNVILTSGERGQQLNINATLQHQCNGNNRIVVNGDAIKMIMNLIDKEWNAVCSILSTLGEYKYDAKSLAPINDSILHRAMYYLFKTAPKISNVHISYGDHDLETARIYKKPIRSNVNLTKAIDEHVLAMMQAKAQELEQKES